MFFIRCLYLFQFYFIRDFINLILVNSNKTDQSCINMGTLIRLLNHTVIIYAFSKLLIFIFCIYHVNFTYCWIVVGLDFTHCLYIYIYCWATSVYANINIFHCLIKNILFKNLVQIFTLFWIPCVSKGKIIDASLSNTY